MARSRVLGRIGALVGAAALLVTMSVGTASAANAAMTSTPSQPGAGYTYVALGDSYAAGYGLPTSPGWDQWCSRSIQSYPAQVAAHFDFVRTDATCQGATIANVLDTPQQIGGGKTVPVQLDALSPTTKIVTVTIGGNDLGFFDILASCVALSAQGPLLLSPSHANCAEVYAAHGGNVLDAKVASTVMPNLTKLFAAIRAKAPDAKVFVVGYPSLMPDTADTPAGGCFSPLGSPNAFPITNADVPFLAGVESTLNDATQTAATQAGFTFVPLQADSVAHTACSTTAPYIRGILPNGSQGFLPWSFHPNLAGATFMAQHVEAAIAKELPAVTTTVDVALVSQNGTALTGGTASYEADGTWHDIPVAHGVAQVALTPGTYTFAQTYNGTRAQQTVTVGLANLQTVTFRTRTVDVHTTQAGANGAAAHAVPAVASYSASGRSWPITATGTVGTAQAEMLPGTYTFTATYNGARLQKSYAVTAPTGTEGAQTVSFEFAAPAAVAPGQPSAVGPAQPVAVGPSVNTGGTVAASTAPATGAPWGVVAGGLGILAAASGVMLRRRLQRR